ncbi:MAG: hypothetical protein ACFFDP_10135 [Promethearchaeota archaeon]
MNLLQYTVFLHGNHDPTLPQLPTKYQLTYRPAVLLRHPDTNILILHGHGTGLITAIKKYPTIHAAFNHIKQQLINNPPPWTYQITKNDWFIAGHRTAPHLNTTTKTAGLSPWTHPLSDHWHGHYITIQPHPRLPPVSLYKYGKIPQNTEVQIQLPAKSNLIAD